MNIQHLKEFLLNLIDIFNINPNMKSKERISFQNKIIRAHDMCLKVNINSTKSINKLFSFLLVGGHI